MRTVSESNGHAVSDWWSEIDGEVLAASSLLWG